MKSVRLKQSEINHLRLLLGWIGCEIGQSPEEFVQTVKRIAPAVQDIDDDAKARLLAHHQKSVSVPKYVRAAVKALRKAMEPTIGQTVDGTARTQHAITKDKP